MMQPSKVGDPECGDQYYAVQWRQGDHWGVQSRESTFERAVEVYDTVKDCAAFEWRIVYVTEMIRVVDYGNNEGV